MKLTRSRHAGRPRPWDYHHDPYDAALPVHSHTLAGLKVQSLDSPIPGPVRQLVAPGEDSHRTLLYNPGTGWRLRSLVSHQIADWTDQPDLHTGQLHHIGHQATADSTCHITLNDDLPDAPAGARLCVAPLTSQKLSPRRVFAVHNEGPVSTGVGEEDRVWLRILVLSAVAALAVSGILTLVLGWAWLGIVLLVLFVLAGIFLWSYPWDEVSESRDLPL